MRQGVNPSIPSPKRMQITQPYQSLAIPPEKATLAHSKLNAIVLESGRRVPYRKTGFVVQEARKEFLFSGEEGCIQAAQRILQELADVSGDEGISDLERLRTEIRMFVRLAESARGRLPTQPS